MFKKVVLALVTAMGLAVPTLQAQVFPNSPLGRPDVGRPPENLIAPPAVSPYLNLNRGGLPGVNYYGLVRPQIDLTQSMQLLQQQLPLGTPYQTAYGQQQVPLTTGHAAWYFSTGQYFPQRYPPLVGASGQSLGGNNNYGAVPNTGAYGLYGLYGGLYGR